MQYCRGFLWGGLCIRDENSENWFLSLRKLLYLYMKSIYKNIKIQSSLEDKFSSLREDI